MRIAATTIPQGYSGVDSSIFDGLRTRGNSVIRVAADVERRYAVGQLLRTFKLSGRGWRRSWRHSLINHPDAFRSRSRVANRALRSAAGSYDVVLHFGGLFAPFLGQYPCPVVLSCDYTMRLAELNWEPWFGFSPSHRREWYALERELYAQASIIMSASENTKWSFVDHFGVDACRVHVVNWGVVDVAEHPNKGYDEQTILFVGLDFLRKGGPTILKAFSGLHEVLPKSRLWMVGPNPGPQLPGVTWFGRVQDRAYLDKLFAEATMLVMPSLCEPFGQALIEAMAHGLPVVGSTVDAMGEIIVEGQTGFLVAPGDNLALQRAMAEVITSADLARRLGDAGRRRVRERFLWSQTIDRVEQALRPFCPA